MKKFTPQEFKNHLIKNQQNYQQNIACDFGKKLKELRTEKGLSQKEMSKRLLIAVSTYANWEQGRTEPSLYHLIMLAIVLNVDMNTLFEFFNFT